MEGRPGDVRAMDESRQRAEEGSTEEPSYVLRPMTRRDIPQVCEIERASFKEPWSRSDFEREFLFWYASEMTVAARGEEVLGYSVLWHTENGLHLANVAVREDRRGRGIGRALVENAIAEARRLRAGRITLEVRESNLKARKLYEELGFRAVEIKRGYYRSDREDAVVMRLDLRRGGGPR